MLKSLVLREIQIKTTIKCHYILTIMAKIIKTDHVKLEKYKLKPQ